MIKKIKEWFYKEKAIKAMINNGKCYIVMQSPIMWLKSPWLNRRVRLVDATMQRDNTLGVIYSDKNLTVTRKELPFDAIGIAGDDIEKGDECIVTVGSANEPPVFRKVKEG